jgi:hypothetical protein
MRAGPGHGLGLGGRLSGATPKPGGGRSRAAYLLLERMMGFIKVKVLIIKSLAKLTSEVAQKKSF